MPRKARKIGESGFYHVVLRGVDRRDIFLDDHDKEKFLRLLRKYTQETGVVIVVYCLMHNHVHLLLQSESPLGPLVKKLLCSYVPYFNKKYERVGHLFQARFFSDPLETDRSMLVVTRYILRNPQAAGFCSVQDYLWSSWHELVSQRDRPFGSDPLHTTELSQGDRPFGPPYSTGSADPPSGAYACLGSICDASSVLEIASGTQQLMSYVLSVDEEAVEEDLRSYKRFTEKQALELMQELCDERGDETTPTGIALLPRRERLALIRRFKKRGLSVRQISRLTGIDRSSVQRA